MLHTQSAAHRSLRTHKLHSNAPLQPSYVNGSISVLGDLYTQGEPVATLRDVTSLQAALVALEARMVSLLRHPTVEQALQGTYSTGVGGWLINVESSRVLVKNETSGQINQFFIRDATEGPHDCYAWTTPFPIKLDLEPPSGEVALEVDGATHEASLSPDDPSEFIRLANAQFPP